MYSVYDEEGDKIVSDKEWCWKNLNTVYTGSTELWIKEQVGYKFEEFKLFFSPSGELLDIECTSSPWHSADKNRTILDRIEKR